jgi:hypothetical protein
MRLEGLAQPALDEQRLEHVLDPVRRPDQRIEPRATAAGAHDGEVAGREVAEAFRLEHDGNTRREVGLSDDEPPAAADFNDET